MTCSGRRHTGKAGPRDLKMELMVQRLWSVGRMGRRRNGGVRIAMSTARSMDDTWKDSRAAGVRPNSLWRVLTPDT